MSEASGVEKILGKAKEEEKQYEWLKAAEHYQEALKVVAFSDLLRKGEISESLAYAVYKAAFQADSSHEFKERMGEALTHFREAKKLYETSADSGEAARASRCDAMILYVDYWLTFEVSEKKRLLNECWQITKEVLHAFREARDPLEYGRSYNQLSMSAWLNLDFEEKFQVRENLNKELVEHGEQAIKFLSTCRDPRELAKAYARTGDFIEWLGRCFHDLAGQEKYFQKAKDYYQRAIELSQETIFLEMSFGALLIDSGVGTDKAQKIIEKALEYVRRTRDRFIIGRTLEMLSHQNDWRHFAEESDESMQFIDRALEYAEEAKRQYSAISFVSAGTSTLWAEAPHAEYYVIKANGETNLAKRRELLGKAMEAIPDLLNRAEKSGLPDTMFYAHHVVGKVLTYQAMIETDSEEKKSFLEKALMHRNETIRYLERQCPFLYWDRALMQMYLARTKFELAKLAKDLESEKKILQEAADDAENGFKLCVQDLAFWESVPGRYSILSAVQYEYGDSLKRLYDITRNVEYLMKAIEAFEDSGKSAQKVDLISRVAESNWKIAQIHDDLGKHLKAAESFTLASNYYKAAAEKIEHLKELYQDLSLYMQAWNEIQKARYYHAKQEYGAAKGHYENAATLHKSLKHWSYLAPNYSAWASIENAEDLSRKEKGEDAVRAFEQAAKLFSETKKLLEIQLAKIENSDEKNMATSMVRATDIRHEYCQARIALEEARILDRKGDHYASSEEYGSAAQTFEKLSQALESEQEKREFRFISILSRAWQKMTRAEAEASPALYFEASHLFEEAKEFGSSEQIKVLTLGHSRFCRALEAGTRFIDTRDATLHDAVVRHLGSASDYYVKAGFQHASEYAKATKLFFDAYVHIGNAEVESDPEKKAKLYAMAEKILEISAGSFMKAEHVAKGEQVRRLLGKVKEERELAMSLSEVLHAPTIVSATTVFSAPTPTHEDAVGLDRFEHAEVTSNLVLFQRELKVGESTELEIELANAGKGQALLNLIEGAVPEGFEIRQKPDAYRVEGCNINMRGKRLDPLKTEEIKFSVKPKHRGSFIISPRIMYVDENGNAKSHQPEPVTITVKELGIKGWIAGDR